MLVSTSDRESSTPLTLQIDFLLLFLFVFLRFSFGFLRFPSASFAFSLTMTSSASDARLASLVAKLSTAGTSAGTTGPAGTADDPDVFTSLLARSSRTGGVGVESGTESAVTFQNLGTFDVEMTEKAEQNEGSLTGRDRTTSMMTPDNLYKLFCTPYAENDFEKLCKGVVGQGVGFCTRTDCDIKAHRTKKAFVLANCLYVLKQSGTVAFVEPSTGKDKMDEDLFEELMNAKNSLSEWNNKFTILNNVDKKASKITMEVEEFYSETMKAYKTPLKGKLDTGSELSFLDITPYKRQLLDTINFEDDSELLKFQDVLQGIDLGLEETSNLVVRVVANQDKIAEEKNKEVNAVSTKLQTLEDLVGHRVVEIHEEYQAPTIWGSVALLASHINSVNDAMREIDPKLGNLFDDFLEQAVSVAHKVSKENVAKTNSTIEYLRQALISSLESLVSSKEKTDLEVQDLRNEVNTIRNVRQKTVPTTSAGGSIFDPASIQDEIDRVKKLQDDLSTKFNSLSAQADKEAIKFCNLGFRTYQESAAWVDINFPDYSFGLVMSMFTVLEHVHATFSGLPSLERLNQLYKLKIDDLNKGLAITSFDSRWPKYFMKVQSTAATTTDQSFFDKVPSYEAWEEPQTGFRDRLKEELETFGQGYNRMILNTLPSGSPAYTVAYNSVTNSISFIESLMGFIDDIYRELTRAKFSKSKAWALVTRLIRRIFMDVAVPRISVQNQFRTGQDDVICKQIFWAEIQSLEIMNQFKAHAFKDHPAIASEYVKFLVTNTGIESLEKLLTRVTNLEEKVSELTKSVKASITSSTTASNKADEVKKSMTDLIRRIGSLEKK